MACIFCLFLIALLVFLIDTRIQSSWEDADCSLYPCYNGGMCLNAKRRLVCSCPEQYTGLQCETMMPRREFCVHGKKNSCTSEPD